METLLDLRSRINSLTVELYQLNRDLVHQEVDNYLNILTKAFNKEKVTIKSDKRLNGFDLKVTGKNNKKTVELSYLYTTKTLRVLLEEDIGLNTALGQARKDYFSVDRDCVGRINSNLSSGYSYHGVHCSSDIVKNDLAKIAEWVSK